MSKRRDSLERQIEKALEKSAKCAERNQWKAQSRYLAQVERPFLALDDVIAQEQKAIK